MPAAKPGSDQANHLKFQWIGIEKGKETVLEVPFCTLKWASKEF